VSYRQQGNIEVSTIDCQMILYKPCGIGRERRVAGKKTRRLISIYQIHIGCAPPSVDPVSVSFVRRGGSANSHAIQLSGFAWRDRDCLSVPLFPEPFRYGRRSEQRNIVG
jgi:hypothetical protein